EWHLNWKQGGLRPVLFLFHAIEKSILRTNEQLLGRREIRRLGGVAGEHVRADRALIAKRPFALRILAEPAEKIYVRVAVDKDVELPVAIPVDDAEGPPAAATEHFTVEAEQARFL